MTYQQKVTIVKSEIEALRKEINELRERVAILERRTVPMVMPQIPTPYISTPHYPTYQPFINTCQTKDKTE